MAFKCYNFNINFIDFRLACRPKNQRTGILGLLRKIKRESIRKYLKYTDLTMSFMETVQINPRANQKIRRNI